MSWHRDSLRIHLLHILHKAAKLRFNRRYSTVEYMSKRYLRPTDINSRQIQNPNF